MVDDLAGALSGNVDVELGQDGVESGRHGMGGGHGNEDVSAGIDELDDSLGSHFGPKTCARISIPSSQKDRSDEPLIVVGRKRR